MWFLKAYTIYLVNFFFQLPSTDEEWKETAHLFETQWQFNNCVGCMDGKHIVIQKPPGSGSLYFNYKSTFSVVLFAVVNANYEFMYVHTGSNGSQSDGGILKNTSFYEKLINNELHLPESYLLPGTDMSVPYVFLGDSAFALEKHIMKPFPERNISRDQTIFNYRLCRARRIVENAFGILASRFRVFRQPINLHLKNIDSVVLASCALHNFLRKRSKTYVTPTCVDREDLDRCSLNTGTWRQATTQLTPLQRNIQRPSSDGKQIRNTLTQYFNGEGRVSFQDRMANVIST